MKRFLFAFIILFVCVLMLHAGEIKTSDDDALSVVSQEVAELQELEKRIQQLCDGTDPLYNEVQAVLEELKKNAEAAQVKVAEIKKQMEETWGPLPEKTRIQLLTRIFQDPNVRVSAVRDLCPENVSFVDFAKMVSVGKQHAPALLEYGQVIAEYEKCNSRDAIIETVMMDLENAAEEKKVQIFLKLMEKCPGFDDISADFPLDELISPLAALVQKFGWQEKELFEEAENVWVTSRPCGILPGARMVKTVDGIEYAFRWCPAGALTLGAPENECSVCWGGKREYDEHKHMVILTRGFWMLETEVTQAMWQSVMGTSISQQRDKVDTSWPLCGEGSNYPMYYVSWEECRSFCEKLSEKLGLTVSLPTEAQWEYACRAGTSTAYSFGSNASNLYQNGNYLDSSCTLSSTVIDSRKDSTHNDGHDRAAPVKSYAANMWGLYDMHGNVEEWCSDWYGPYSQAPTEDPTGPKSGSYRVIRGGSWSYRAQDCRSAFRDGSTPDVRYPGLGFRPVLASPVPEE